MATLINHLRRWRFECGQMTQAELATRAGVSRQTIVALEKQRYSPSLELAFRIAKVFNQPLEAVFEYQSVNDNSVASP